MHDTDTKQHTSYLESLLHDRMADRLFPLSAMIVAGAFVKAMVSITVALMMTVGMNLMK